MFYQSTRGDQHLVTSTKAVLKGIANDGGLYMPKNINYSKFDWQTLMTLSTKEMAERILCFFLDDFIDPEGIVSRAYDNKFDTEELTPLVKVGDKYVLELFHGPTSAFKDVALSVLPQLMVEAKKAEHEKKKIVILTATSGDTGKAALEGFHDVDGIDIIVFFPDGGVSTVQKLQMVTQVGKNVHSCAVKGNFDDCQTGVKNIFNQVSQSGLPGNAEVVLSSANSINIGRLVPQVVYYFKAYAELLKAGAVKLDDKVDYTVPTGNFGDILAGYFAKKLGLPIGNLICASNKNNVLTDFINTGVYNKKREFYKTTSPSMDILVSSNLERLLYMVSYEDSKLVKSLMDDLSSKGEYTIPDEIRERIQTEFKADFATDEQASQAIKTVWENNKYLMDTHTATAWSVAEKFKSEVPMVVLSTASPYKFPKAVSKALGLKPLDDEFEIMNSLSKFTSTKVPKNLAELKEKEVRFTDVIEKDKMLDYVIATVNK